MIFKPGMTWQRYDNGRWGWREDRTYSVDCSKWGFFAQWNMARNIWTK